MTAPTPSVAEVLERAASKHPGLAPEGRAQRLRDAYADAVAGLRYIEQGYGRLYGVGWDRVFDAFDDLVTIPEREGLPAGFKS